MTIEQLETFINACKSDSFATPAGFHRYTSSAHEDILALEKEFDTILFLREGKKTGVLTEAGLTLYREALPLVRQYYRTMRMMDLHRMHEDRTVVIGTIPILRQYRLTQLFKRFAEEHEAINIRFEEVDNRMLMDGMRENYYDAIITRKTMLDPSLAVNTYPLASDEMAVILSDSHPLAYEPSINIRKLKNEDFYLTDPITTSYGLSWKVLVDNHISTEHVHTGSTDDVFEAVQQGKGVALMSISSLSFMKMPGLLAVPLRPRVPLAVVFCTNRNLQKCAAMDELVDMIEKRSKTIPA